MNIKTILYGGTLIALLGSGIATNTTRNAEPEQMFTSAVKELPARETRIINNNHTISTSELEHIIRQQHNFLRTSNNKYEMTPEKESVISTDYSLTKVFTESTNKINAESHVGASGLWQIMRSAWDQVEKKHDYNTYKYDPQINTRLGIKYMIHIYDFLEQNHPQWSILSINDKQELISAAYNGGPSRLITKKFNIEQMPKETKKYVKKMKEQYPIIQNNNYTHTSNDLKTYYTINK